MLNCVFCAYKRMGLCNYCTATFSLFLNIMLNYPDAPKEKTLNFSNMRVFGNDFDANAPQADTEDISILIFTVSLTAFFSLRTRNAYISSVRIIFKVSISFGMSIGFGT